MQPGNLSYVWQGDLHRLWATRRTGTAWCRPEQAVLLRPRSESGTECQFLPGEALRSVTEPEPRSARMSPVRAEAGQAPLDMGPDDDGRAPEQRAALERVSSPRPWSVLAVWPRRRWVAAGGLAVPLIAMYVQVVGRGGSAWALSSAVASGSMAALILASYVPQSGSARLVEVSCSPCAAVGAGAVIGSMIFWSTQPQDVGIILLALALLVFGLVQRLTGVQACRVQALADGEGGSDPE